MERVSISFETARAAVSATSASSFVAGSGLVAVHIGEPDQNSQLIIDPVLQHHPELTNEDARDRAGRGAVPPRRSGPGTRR